MSLSIDDLKKQIEPLKSQLGDRVGDEEILNRLIKYTHTHRMKLEASRRAILRDYGIKIEKTVQAEIKNIPISEIREEQSPVTVIAKVLEISKSTVNVKNEPKSISKLLIEDDTAHIVLTVWQEDVDVECNHVYKFSRCKVSSYKSELNLSVNGNESITELKDTFISGSPKDKFVETAYNLDDLEVGMDGIAVICTVEYCYQKQINTKNGLKTIYTAIVSDNSEKMELTSWKEIHIEQRKKYCFSKIKVKEWRGTLSLEVDNSCIVFEVE